MRLSLTLPLLWLTTSVHAQAAPAPTTLIHPARCATADSLLGTDRAKPKADLNAVYLSDRHQSLVFSLVPRGLPTTAGVRYTTGLIRLPERQVGAVPSLELSLRVFSDTERMPGTQLLRLLADDSILGDSLPSAMRRQEAPGVRRILQSFTVPLTPEQTLALAKARRVSGVLADTPFHLSNDELRDLRALVVVGLCGSSRPW